jgi:putative heme iron utilization protein
MSDQQTDDAVERLKGLLPGFEQGVLSTRLPDSGHPYGSLIKITVDESFRATTLLSELAQHTENIAEDSRASILLEQARGDNTLDRARVTLVGDIDAVDKEPDVRETFLETHPEASRYVDFDDFSFYVFEFTKARFIGGFGDISWVRASQF